MTDLVLAYLGPEVILPATSVVAAAIGILLMGWRFVLRLVRIPFQYLFARGTPDGSASAPPSIDVAPSAAEAALFGEARPEPVSE
jgi:hypothetical protein